MTPRLRALRRETTVSAGELVMPIFINENLSKPKDVASMPGIRQLDQKSAISEIR